MVRQSALPVYPLLLVNEIVPLAWRLLLPVNISDIIFIVYTKKKKNKYVTLDILQYSQRGTTYKDRFQKRNENTVATAFFDQRFAHGSFFCFFQHSFSVRNVLQRLVQFVHLRAFTRFLLQPKRVRWTFFQFWSCFFVLWKTKQK